MKLPGPNPGRHGVEKGWSPSGGLIWGPLAASWGLSSVFCLLSSLFSLLSSLFSLLLVVVVLRRLDPMRRVTHSTHDKPCQFSCSFVFAGVLKGWSPLGGLVWGSLAAFFVISSLFSLLASLCALLSSLFSLLPSLFSHPSLLSSLFSLLSLLSSLFSRCCSFLRSLFALVTSNFASSHQFRFQSARPCASASLAWKISFFVF